MRVVLDTNVIVSALRSRDGASFELLRRLRAGRFEAAITVALLLEYEEVVSRQSEVLGLRGGDVEVLMDAVARLCVPVGGSTHPRPRLADPDDELVLEAALAGGAEVIVTHNVRHFANARKLGVRVATPAEFLRESLT